MRKHIAACAAACVGVVAATITFAATRIVLAANCLEEPAASTPAGYHWNYRLDHANNRKCWYLKSISGTAEKKAAPRAPRSARSLDDESPTHSTTRRAKEGEALFEEFLRWQKRQESER